MISEEKLIKDIDNFFNKIDLAKRPWENEWFFEVGNCYLRLNNFSEANRMYQISFNHMFADFRFWEKAGMVNLLVEISVLSGVHPGSNKSFLFLKSIKKNYYGYFPMASYTYACMDLLMNEDDSAEAYLPKIMKNKKHKVAIAIGEIITAIIEHNENNLKTGFEALLKAHNGIVKHGELRETPEGYICMSGMALAK